MKKWVLIAVAALFISGCTDQEKETEVNEKPKENSTEEVNSVEETDPENAIPKENVSVEETSWIEKFEAAPEVKMSPEYLANQPQGPYADISYDSNPESYQEFLKVMEGIPENATEEELDKVFNYIVSQVSVDVTDPQTVIDSWKVSSFGDPEIEDSRYQFKENYNIEVILDSSGSMANITNGKTRMVVAKEAIQQFLMSAPEKANVALRVYGHKGTSKDSDKKLSCDSSELVYKFGSYKEKEFNQALSSFEPAGWTPLAQSLMDAQNDLKEFKSDKNTNMIYVVSDGIETCDGNPVEAAKKLGESDLQPVINIIGFGVDSEGQKQLKEMATASNGTYTNVHNSNQLKSEFDKAKNALEKWKQWKENANYDAKVDRNKRYLDTNSLNNEYSNNIQKQQNNMVFIINGLRNKDLITSEQKEYLTSRKSELAKEMDEARKTIREDLENLNAKTLEDTKKQIEEKYNQNTQ
ncbi:VWA domain-containing protein [Pradoshia sp. D12]|uniref:VWA domain-containing protein n=1 Tax=Bacillaceae TaxID=186817 RepID=UPI00080AF32B|nr:MULTISPECIES: VWA domain-containing protein [Bacillaceae]OCA80725.1 hypothetical protein A8L44_16280 [Bacillus sp. FJAT-27986]QFK70065.1 VWA domain-containing protein [Pradoshia sp. D12]TPF70625.1 VWA domain-containing protein [Bacillus sp. D12]